MDMAGEGRDPGDADGLIERGAQLIEIGRFADAERCLRSALALEPGNATALWQLADALRRRGRPREARDPARQAVVAAPDDAEAHWELAAVQLDLDDDKDAVVSACTAVRLEPHWAAAHDMLASALQRDKQFDVALASATRAVELDPDDADYRVTVGWVQIERDEDDAAIAAFHQALRLDPTSTEARSGLAQLDVRRGRIGPAAEVFAGLAGEAPAEGYAELLEAPVLRVFAARFGLVTATLLVLAVGGVVAGALPDWVGFAVRACAGAGAFLLVVHAVRLLAPAWSYSRQGIRLATPRRRFALCLGLAVVATQIVLLGAAAVTGLTWTFVAAGATLVPYWLAILLYAFGLSNYTDGSLKDDWATMWSDVKEEWRQIEEEEEATRERDDDQVTGPDPAR